MKMKTAAARIATAQRSSANAWNLAKCARQMHNAAATSAASPQACVTRPSERLERVMIVTRGKRNPPILLVWILAVSGTGAWISGQLVKQHADLWGSGGARAGLFGRVCQVAERVGRPPRERESAVPESFVEPYTQDKASAPASPRPADAPHSTDRRRFLREVGKRAIYVASVIVALSVSQAQASPSPSGVPSGEACLQDSDCCSNRCSGASMICALA